MVSTPGVGVGYCEILEAGLRDRGLFFLTTRNRGSRLLLLPRVVRTLVNREGTRGIDQRDVAECLREVTDQPLSLGVVLLRQQPNVVAQAEQPLKHLAPLVSTPHQGIGLRQPERTGEKRSFSWRQSIHAV